MATKAEPTAADRVAAAQRCGACSAVPPVPLERAPIRDVGMVWLCMDPAACRRRAVDAGTWCR